MKNVLLSTFVVVFAIMAIVPTALFAEKGDEAVVLATYKDGEITLEQLRAKLDKIPEMYKNRYRTTAGQEQILDAMCVEQLYYLEALELGIENEEQIQEAIRMALKPVYVSVYRENAFKEDLVITDDEMRSFYDSELDRLYTTKPVYTMQYMRVNSDSVAIEVRQKFDEGVDFIDLQNQYSTSEYARNRGGRVTFAFKYDRYIPGVGRDTLLCESIATAESDRVVGPIHTDNGFHFFKVLEFTPSRVQTFDEVKDDVRNRLRPLKESERYYNTIGDLFDKYGVKFDEELMTSVNLEDRDVNEEMMSRKLAWGDDPSLTFTVEQAYAAFRRMQPQETAQYTMPGGVQTFVNRQLEDSVFYLDALTKGYEENPDTAWDIEQARRAVLIREAYNRIVIGSIDTSDEAVQTFYDENIEVFTSKPTRTIQAFVFATEKEAIKYRKKVAKYAKKSQEEKIDSVVEKYSSYKKENGVFDNLGQNAVLPLFGRNEELTSAIWDTTPGEVSDVFMSKYDSNDSYLFIRVITEEPATPKPLEEVRQVIENRLKQLGSRERFEEVNTELEQKYALQKFPDRLKVDFTAEELFTLAEDAQKKRKYQDAVMYYDQVIDSFPNNKDDYKALFMKAFLMAEEMNQKPMAIQVFQQVIDNYPEGELHESAQFMIETLTGKVDILQEIDESENKTEATE